MAPAGPTPLQYLVFNMKQVFQISRVIVLGECVLFVFEGCVVVQCKTGGVLMRMVAK